MLENKEDPIVRPEAAVSVRGWDGILDWLMFSSISGSESRLVVSSSFSYREAVDDSALLAKEEEELSALALLALSSSSISSLLSSPDKGDKGIHQRGSPGNLNHPTPATATTSWSLPTLIQSEAWLCVCRSEMIAAQHIQFSGFLQWKVINNAPFRDQG